MGKLGLISKALRSRVGKEVVKKTARSAAPTLDSRVASDVTAKVSPDTASPSISKEDALRGDVSRRELMRAGGEKVGEQLTETAVAKGTRAATGAGIGSKLVTKESVVVGVATAETADIATGGKAQAPSDVTTLDEKAYNEAADFVGRVLDDWDTFDL